MFDYRGLHLCKVGNMSEAKKENLHSIQVTIPILGR